MTTLPLFPLSVALLPYGRMPLQIFEQRYLDLVKHAMRSGEGFGIIAIERGAEVAPVDVPALAPIGCIASIVDWDQLENGLLGNTVQGGQRFRPHHAWREGNGLIRAEVETLPALAPAPMTEAWEPLRTVLEGLAEHPHVQRIGLDVDRDDAWQVGFTLVQLLPIDERLKVVLLGADEIGDLMDELADILARLAGD